MLAVILRTELNVTNAMKKITTTILTVLMTISFAFGQTQKATTESGKKVILNTDGTWKFADTVITTQTNSDPNDCSNWIAVHEDKVAGRTMTIMKEPINISRDGEESIRLSLLLTQDKSIIFSMTAKGATGCIEEGAKINILFTDGTRLELKSDGEFNCKGKATLYFRGSFGKKSELNELKEKTLETLRIWTSDLFVEGNFTKGQAEQFKNALNCLAK